MIKLIFIAPIIGLLLSACSPSKEELARNACWKKWSENDTMKAMAKQEVIEIYRRMNQLSLVEKWDYNDFVIAHCKNEAIATKLGHKKD